MDPRGTTRNDSQDGISRRTILVSGTGTALGAVVLAACGSGDESAGNAAPPASSAPPGGGGAGAAPLAKVADVPVGGAVSAKSADGKPVIVAQPSAGEVVAFSAICTHMGCTVAPDGGILTCPCHGSTYSLATGKNTGGPAPRPLSKVPVRVRDGEVVET